MARPVGWRNESARHSLASRGIKTVASHGVKKPKHNPEDDFVRVGEGVYNYHLYHWKCPSCDKSFWMWENIEPASCPHCGKGEYRGKENENPKNQFWKSLEIEGPTEEEYNNDPYKYDAEHERMIEELYDVGGYYDPAHWYVGNGPELIIISERMWNDPKARDILRRYGVKL